MCGPVPRSGLDSRPVVLGKVPAPGGPRRFRMALARAGAAKRRTMRWARVVAEEGLRGGEAVIGVAGLAIILCVGVWTLLEPARWAVLMFGKPPTRRVARVMSVVWIVLPLGFLILWLQP